MLLPDKRLCLLPTAGIDNAYLLCKVCAGSVRAHGQAKEIGFSVWVLLHLRLLSAKEAPAEAGAKDKGNPATSVAHVREGMPQIISNLHVAVKQNTKKQAG